MKSKNLLVAAIVLAALSGVVWWSKRHPESVPSSTTPTAASPKLVDIPDAQINSIAVQKKGSDAVDLDRKNGKWAITAPQQLPADQDSATSMVSSLSPLTGDSVVEDKPADISKYGLNNPSLTVTISEKNGKSDKLIFGDDVPAGSLVYAQTGSSSKVYAVSSSTKTSFDKSLNDLRDKRLLMFDSNNLTRVELDSAKSDIEFGKNGQNDWAIIKPASYRADSFQVEELLRKLADAKMDLSATDDSAKKAATDFASGTPVGSAKVTDASGTQTLDVHKNKDDYYAKSSAVTGFFKVSADLGKEMEKSLDDFRNKKIFDFGFSDPTKLELQEGASDKSLARSGTDWKMNGQTMDPGQVQAFIDKLRDLAATKFVTAGFTAPEFSVTVVSNDGKRTEKADFSKTSDGYIARRGTEPALYQLDTKTVTDMLEAGKAIKPTPGSKK